MNTDAAPQPDPVLNIIPVESSAIKSLTYDGRRKVLGIQFTSGHSYLYFAVPKSALDRMLKADSIGKFYHREIKDVYESERIEDW